MGVSPKNGTGTRTQVLLAPKEEASLCAGTKTLLDREKKNSLQKEEGLLGRRRKVLQKSRRENRRSVWMCGRREEEARDEKLQNGVSGKTETACQTHRREGRSVVERGREPKKGFDRKRGIQREDLPHHTFGKRGKKEKKLTLGKLCSNWKNDIVRGTGWGYHLSQRRGNARQRNSEMSVKNSGTLPALLLQLGGPNSRGGAGGAGSGEVD